MNKQQQAANAANNAARPRKWSNNAKLNAVLSEIETDLREMCETEAESIGEIKRYISEFQKESDHNLAQYGNLIVYNCHVRAMYMRCGYSCKRWSDAKLWEIYKRQVGFVARAIVANA